MKRLGCVFLGLIITFGSIYAQTPTPIEYFNLEMSDNGEFCIISGFSDVGIKKRIKDLIIPTEVEGIPINNYKLVCFSRLSVD